MGNNFHKLHLKQHNMNFAYQIRSYSDKVEITQTSVSDYAIANGMELLDGEDGLPNLCAVNVQAAPPPLNFIDSNNDEVYNAEIEEYWGSKPIGR